MCGCIIQGQLPLAKAIKNMAMQSSYPGACHNLQQNWNWHLWSSSNINYMMNILSVPLYAVKHQNLQKIRSWSTWCHNKVFVHRSHYGIVYFRKLTLPPVTIYSKFGALWSSSYLINQIDISLFLSLSLFAFCFNFCQHLFISHTKL